MSATMMAASVMVTTMTTPVIPVTTTVVVVFYIPMTTMSVMAMGAIIVMMHFPIRIMMMVVSIVPDQRRSHRADGQTGHYCFCSAVAMSMRALVGHRHRYRHHTRQ